MPKSSEDPGSRDLARGLADQVQDKLMELLVETDKLRHSDKNRLIHYRTADAHITMALSHMELAKLQLRKRKKRERKELEIPMEAQGVPEEIPA